MQYSFYCQKPIIKTAFLSMMILATIFLHTAFSQVPAASHTSGSQNNDMNWIISTEYNTTGDVISQNKNFYDNIGSLLQTQNKVLYRTSAGTGYVHVLASQPLKDAYGRAAASTMAAPIDYADFNYMPNFVLASDNVNKYTYKNFDRFNPSGTETDKTNSPEQVGGQSVKGTLGWYYGPNNNWEPYTPTSNYPYLRQTFYRDGTGNVKKQGDVGDIFKMGSGHETNTCVTRVINELNHYLTVRNAAGTSAILGTMPNALGSQAIQIISQNADGQETVAIQDKNGNVLMTARPGADLMVSNTINLASFSVINNAPQIKVITGTNVLLQGVTLGVGNMNIYSLSSSGIYSLIYSGLASSVPTNQNLGNGTWYFISDNIFMLAYSIGGSNKVAYSSDNSDPLPIPTMAYFRILADNTTVDVTSTGGSGTASDYTLYDMNSETIITLPANKKLNKGYYAIVDNAGAVTLTYSSGYTDISYYYYNQLDQLVAAVAPAGVKNLINNPTVVNYATLYTYNPLGRLISIQDPDRGTTQFVYRKDGKLRFFQNAKQASNTNFSYINYDQYGRPIESGDYLPEETGDITFNSPAMTSILENTSASGGLVWGSKSEVVMTVYDVPDNSHAQSSYTQDPNYLGGQVSTIKKYSYVENNSPSGANLISQSWYNYDEEGKVLWMIQGIATNNGLAFKTTDYAYDPLDNLTTRTFQKANSTETFLHYYEYDPVNQDLVKVSTNTDANNSTSTRKLQATYTYYLHGPLKRVELGDKLQGIDYTYTLQGALKAINNSNKTADPGGDGIANTVKPDQFGMVLDYFNGDYANTRSSGAKPINGVNTSGFNPIPNENFTGNIRAASWYSEKSVGSGLSNAPLAYAYYYDDKNQYAGNILAASLVFPAIQSNNGNGATFTVPNPNPGQEWIVLPNTTTPAYDANGNILNLQRTDATGAVKDKFTYHYVAGTNRLSNVVDNAPTPPVTYATYTYDEIGREISETTTDPTNQTKYLQYDVSGNVIAVARDANFNQPVVKYVYGEFGQRVKKLTYNSSYQLTQITYYFGDVIYTQSVSGTTYGSLVAQEYQIQGGDGRIGVFYKQSNLYAYELTDHLGNVRAVVALNGSSIQVISSSDYYPFGSISLFGGTSGYRYDYQGGFSEKDGETGWNAFELRMYDPRVGRWLITDPADQYWSPYIAMGNDPSNIVDPDGGTDGGTGKEVDCPSCELPSVTVTPSAWQKMSWEGWGAWVDRQMSLGFSVDQMQRFLQSQDIGSRAMNNFLSQSSESSLAYRRNMSESWKAQGEVAAFIAGFLVPEGEIAGVVGRVIGKKVATWAAKTGGRVFWSGGGNEAVEAAAREFAAKNGMTTLEMTRAGKNLTNLTQGMSWAEKGPMWQRLSTQFAKGANGTVHVFQNAGGVNVKSVFGTVEYPILKQNGVNIIYHIVP